MSKVMRVGSNTFDDAEKWTFKNPIFVEFDEAVITVAIR